MFVLQSGILYDLGYFRSPVFIFTSHRSLMLTVSCQDSIQGCCVQRESKKACFWWGRWDRRLQRGSDLIQVQMSHQVDKEGKDDMGNKNTP